MGLFYIDLGVDFSSKSASANEDAELKKKAKELCKVLMSRRGFEIFSPDTSMRKEKTFTRLAQATIGTPPSLRKAPSTLYTVFVLSRRQSGDLLNAIKSGDKEKVVARFKLENFGSFSESKNGANEVASDIRIMSKYSSWHICVAKKKVPTNNILVNFVAAAKWINSLLSPEEILKIANSNREYAEEILNYRQNVYREIIVAPLRSLCTFTLGDIISVNRTPISHVNKIEKMLTFKP